MSYVRYSEEIATAIVTRIAQGESLRRICSDPEMPGKYAVWEWVDTDKEGFAKRYYEARIFQAHMFVDEIMDLADDSRNDWMQRNDPENPGWLFNRDHVNRVRLRIDSRKWFAGKIVPKIYGDRVMSQTLDREGNPADPVIPVLNVVIAKE